MAASRSTITVYDTHVRRVSAFRSALWCTLTLGVTGAIRQKRLNDELMRVGRRRGRMPFSYISVTPGTAATAWCFGMLGWFGAVAAIGYTAYLMWQGEVAPEAEWISAAASLAICLAPLWMTALHTARRVRRAQHLVGVPNRYVRLDWAPMLAVVFPPLYLWYMQRNVNRAWDEWRTDG
jgi:hypothetical protein